MSVKILEPILINQHTGAFPFGARLRSKDLNISINDLGTAKAMNPFSVGSCSLHEPDGDLSRFSLDVT
jgi:hypothetical protein